MFAGADQKSVQLPRYKLRLFSVGCQRHPGTASAWPGDRIFKRGAGAPQPAAGAESWGRDEQSRGAHHSVLARWRPAEADGGRKRGSSPCLRARAARSAGPRGHAETAQRGVSSWRSEIGATAGPATAPISSGAQVCAGCRFASCNTDCVALTKVQTLRFCGKGSCVSQKK
jgi:hypothetical protein